MKICRCRIEQRVAYGLVEGDLVALLAEPPFERIVRTGESVPLSDVKLLAPCEPSKIIGTGLNHRAHADELKKPLPDRPLLFLKPPTCVLDPEEPILLPPESTEVHHEAEMALVIGRKTRRVTAAQARECILGVTCFNDVTARDIQRTEIQYTRAKSFDTFGPFGPFIETSVDPRKLLVKGVVNGTVRQLGSTADMVFDPFELVAFASRGMTLMPGDVLATGTPPGVGSLSHGDVVEIAIEGVGSLRNPVLRDEG